MRKTNCTAPNRRCELNDNMAGIGNIFVAPHRRFIRLQTTHSTPNEWLSRVRDIVWNLDKCIHTIRGAEPTADHKTICTSDALQRRSRAVCPHWCVYGYWMWTAGDLKGIGREMAGTWTEHEKVTQRRMENASYGPRGRIQKYQENTQELLSQRWNMRWCWTLAIDQLRFILQSRPPKNALWSELIFVIPSKGIRDASSQGISTCYENFISKPRGISSE